MMREAVATALLQISKQKWHKRTAADYASNKEIILVSKPVLLWLELNLPYDKITIKISIPLLD